MENSAKNSNPAANSNSPSSSNEPERISFDQKYEKELSFQRYLELGVWRKVIGWTGSLGGMAIGGVIGKQINLIEKIERIGLKIAATKVGISSQNAGKIADTLLDAKSSVDSTATEIKEFFNKIKNLGTDAPNKVSKKLDPAGMFIGMIIGSTIAGFALGYKRWRRVEAERIAVSEINEDVANMKIRTRTDESLLQENTALREMWEEEIGNTGKLTAALEKKSPMDHATREIPNTLKAI